MAILSKARANGNPSTAQYNVHYYIRSAMSCGNNYHTARSHLFKNEEDDNAENIDLLIFILTNLELGQVIKKTDDSFWFKGSSGRKHRFMFKLCRYVRTKEIRKILELTKDFIEEGVAPYNAFLMAHYAVEKTVQFWNYYIPIMDIIPLGIYTKPQKTFFNRELFHERFISPTRMMNNIFEVNYDFSTKDIEDLFKTKTVLEIEQIMM